MTPVQVKPLPPLTLFLFRVQQILQLAHELADVAEMTVHRGEPDVGDRVQFLQAGDDQFADGGDRHFFVIAIEDFRLDYSEFSKTLPDEFFPPGANWLMLGPSGPRRLRLAIEHLA